MKIHLPNIYCKNLCKLKKAVYLSQIKTKTMKNTLIVLVIILLSSCKSIEPETKVVATEYAEGNYGITITHKKNN